MLFAHNLLNEFQFNFVRLKVLKNSWVRHMGSPFQFNFVRLKATLSVLDRLSAVISIQLCAIKSRLEQIAET